MPDGPLITSDRAALIERAAVWLSEQPYQARPVPLLRERFGLTASEACRAIDVANRMRVGRAAFA